MVLKGSGGHWILEWFDIINFSDLPSTRLLSVLQSESCIPHEIGTLKDRQWLAVILSYGQEVLVDRYFLKYLRIRAIKTNNLNIRSERAL
jgi:hypothetical protein